MSKIFILLMIAIFSLNNFCSQTVETKTTFEKFEVEKLSIVGKTAYQTLLKAERFEDGLIGYAAQLSENVKSLNLLVQEKEADAAFKSLLNEATLAGQLYALCGLYYTDHVFFKKAVEKYKKDETEVSTMSGCEIFNEKTSKIIESKSPNVAIIPPSQTIKDWWNKNKSSYEIDIIHGGYPASFRNLRDFKQNKSNK